ncbi:OmpA family protein [Zooshikella sp. RANM57]|uniref:OmpA family protein n=1 Tax=Zooshikella sp. RANM57 TaxID=3425863 RepID=UPI003D70069A
MKPSVKSRTLGLLVFLPIFLTGCATNGPWHEDWRNCALVGGGLGAVAGSSADDGEAAAVGALGGALLGGFFCSMIEHDTDDDGVVDSKDKCPATPRGVKVDYNGCPVDSDNDGVPDYRDQCPNTPLNTQVDNRGCTLDSDNDGVANMKDHCPNTPPGVKVNAIGCSEALALEGVQFEFNSARLTGTSHEYLSKVAEKLRLHTNTKIEVSGHTDNVGSNRYNLRLSQRRAEAVRNFLVSRGVNSSNLSAVGYGEEKPITSNSTEAGRAMNRRVELNVVDH